MTPRTPSAGNAGRDAVASALNDAVRHHQAGRLQAAAAGYRRILAVYPQQPDALHLLGLLSHQRGDQVEAERWVRAAVVASPRVAAYHNTLAAVFLAKGDSAAAMTAAQRAVALDGRLVAAHNTLGNALLRTGQAREAVASYRRALSLAADHPETLNNLGSALHTLSNLAEAERALRQALIARPHYAAAAANLALVLRDQGRLEDALAACDQALSQASDNPTWRANRATLLLQLGRFEEGWAEYEHRWQVEGFTKDPIVLPEPRWQGDALDGRTLLLQGEQGLGSMIQFARYAPLIAARGGTVVLQCPQPLKRLFASSFAAPAGRVASVIAKDEALPGFDVHAPLMSLPYLCRTTLASIPANVPYLRTEPALIDAWKERLGDVAGPGRRRIGLVWAGNPSHANDHNRSMPATALLPLFAVPDTRFYALQVGSPQPPPLLAAGLIDLAPALSDFAETAAALANLDLIISVDTAVAHLAGALARPVWLLTPPIPEWRWLIGRDDSPWYPTMRLFRQRQLGDWEELVERIVAELAIPVNGIPA